MKEKLNTSDETPVKYQKLKRKYQEIIESRDSTALALQRAQKLLLRARENNDALLERVQLLESAAGLTPEDVNDIRESILRNDRANEFPLLHRPIILPTLEDRPRELPVLTTSTDLTHSSYNDPIGPPSAPRSYPPRLRSHILQSLMAAQKLKENDEARRVALGLPRSSHSAIAILGIEGSVVADRVERILSGGYTNRDADMDDDENRITQTAERSAASNSGKRKRESSGSRISTAVTSRVGRGRAEGAIIQAGTAYNPMSELSNPLQGQTQGVATNSTSAESEKGKAADVTAASAAASKQQPKKDVDTLEDEDEWTSTHDAFNEENTPSHQNHEGDDDDQRYRRSFDAIGGEKSMKPKRLKTHGIRSGTYQIPFVPRHPDGSPHLPLPVGIVMLRKLGSIQVKGDFFTERYLFPVGYECSRKYSSMVDPTETVEYVSRIINGGDGAPRFEIDPADQPDVVISSGTPTGAWAQVVRAANKIRERNHSNSVSGPDYYGLAQNTIKALIQELPGAKQVPEYVWQHFVEEPDPATVDSEDLKLLKKAAGPKRVIGSRRKGRGTTEDSRVDLDNNEHSANFDLLPPSESSTGTSPMSHLLHHHSPAETDIIKDILAEHSSPLDPYALPSATANVVSTDFESS